MATFSTKIRLLIESHVLVILAFIQPLPPSAPPPMLFDLFADDDVVLVIRTKRGHDKEINNPIIDYLQVL